MAQDAREYELVLLGATGYTGKLTAEWISANLPTNLRWAIAGRNAKKLQAVIDELTVLNPNRKQPAIETCELEQNQLTSLAKRTRLIITTVGPYMWYGEPVLAACAENGTHYLDCTGEVPWYHDMVSKYHETAKRNGAIIIPQCGLDSVPADIMSFALTSHIRKTLQAPTLSVVLTLYALKSGVSGGTSQTALNLFSHYPLSKLAETMKPYSLSPVRPTSPSKKPPASLFYRLLGLVHIPELGGIQTVGMMASVDTCLVHRSWGLFEETSKASSRPELSWGPKFRFMEYMRAKSLVSGALIRFGMALAGLFLAFPPSRWILSPLITKFVIPAPGEGPSKEAQKGDFLNYRSVGVADTQKKEKVLGRLECAHGAYPATALTLAAAADVILRGNIRATEAGKLGGGILTPATLGELYVEKLNAFGMKIEVGI
ncbi:hypothetical protein K505DRAFT_313590 [Melanomma pulvis-pyrius CBS 109.77]|uniref:Saccharopine dehydrogenase NADP binding domain-containing protein n=1 Tax=Melanomma pulvis-pyrius CBS 109.77 TaxID=1314802 RepID=A0A6A6WZ86_9PLEO|nr:hypothetical protein K505DRAFT_313590 [Melanomma pulvis-pyrius CBS 109.77]